MSALIKAARPPLTFYDDAKRALAAAVRVDDAKKIRDRAVAIRLAKGVRWIAGDRPTDRRHHPARRHDHRPYGWAEFPSTWDAEVRRTCFLGRRSWPPRRSRSDRQN
jgi:hypothetical protein